MARDSMARDETAGGPPDDTWQPVEDTGFIGHVGPMFAKEGPTGRSPVLQTRPPTRLRRLSDASVSKLALRRFRAFFLWSCPIRSSARKER